MKRPTFTDISRAYRGYIIAPHGITLLGWYIEKDGYFIGYASSIDDAKRIIDQLA